MLKMNLNALNKSYIAFRWVYPLLLCDLSLFCALNKQYYKISIKTTNKHTNIKTIMTTKQNNINNKQKNHSKKACEGVFYICAKCSALFPFIHRLCRVLAIFVSLPLYPFVFLKKSLFFFKKMTFSILQNCYFRFFYSSFGGFETNLLIFNSLIFLILFEYLFFCLILRSFIL